MRKRDTENETDRLDRETERQRQAERQRKKETESEKQRETETERERASETERERDRALGLKPGSSVHQCKENACVRMASVGEIGFHAVNVASIVLAEDSSTSSSARLAPYRQLNSSPALPGSTALCGLAWRTPPDSLVLRGLRGRSDINRIING
ncbi:unnamed protein product [Gadus morhua 'NCC']